MNPLGKYLIITIAALSIMWPQSMAASNDCRAPEDKTIIQAIELAPAIPEQPSIGQDEREFYRTQVQIDYTPGQQVGLGSTPGGLDPTHTDDFVKVWVGVGKNASAWSYDYRSTDRLSITTLPPVDLTSLFNTRAGRVTVTIALTDLTPPRFSSSPYYLVIYQPCAPMPAPSPTATSLPSATNTPLPTATPTQSPTVTVTPTSVPPTATATPVPPTATATATMTPTVQSAVLLIQPTAPPTVNPTATTVATTSAPNQIAAAISDLDLYQLQVSPSGFWTLVGLSTLAVLGMITAGVWLIWCLIAHLRQPTWRGEIVVWFDHTLQATYTLGDFTQHKLAIGRFAAIDLPHLAQSTPVACLVSKNNDLYLQKLSPYPPQQVVEELSMHYGDRHAFGGYVVEYQAEQETATADDNYTKGAVLA